MEKYGVTVKEILNLDIVNRLKIAAGEKGLHRVIKLVNVIEVPDIADWLLEGEFFLTTGYSFREHPHLIDMLIPKMARNGGAGLAIKPKRYFKEIPSKLIEQANEHNVPLLEVPFDLSFSEVMAPILAVISNNQYKILKQSEQAHTKLMDIIFRGRLLQDLCLETGKIINNPVAILDSNNELISPNEEEKRLFSEILSDDSKLIKKRKLRMSNVKELEYSIYLDSEYKNVKVLYTPIFVNNNTYGYLYVLCNNRLNESDILIIERAASTAALDFLKRKAVFEVERNYYNEYLDILLSREFKDEEEIIKRGEVFNINLRKPTAVMVINVNDGNNEAYIKDINNNPKDNILKYIFTYKNSLRDNNFIAGIKGNLVVILTEVSKEDPEASLKNIAAGFINYLTKHEHKLKIGVGRHYTNIMDIEKSFYEAKQALKICQLSNNLTHISFDDLGFYKILSGKSKEDLETFAKEHLLPLIKYDKEYNGELLKTLQTYYSTNRNLKKTSELIYSHYNTILYRMKKIKELTGIDLNNPESSLNLEIAINILKLFQIEIQN